MKSTLHTKFSLLLGLLALVMAPSLRAITINDANLVGIITLNGNSVPSDPVSEAGYLNTLLAMAANQTVGVAPAIVYQTGPTDYNGTVSGGVQDTTGGTAVPAGYAFVLAKYDGPNAGYVAYATNGGAFNLPQYPSPTFTSNPNQYALSHWTGFPGGSVPDGGQTLVLLACALLVSEGFRRRFFNRA